MNIFTQTTLIIGKITEQSIQMLGTGFLISNDGKIATVRHVIGPNDKNIVVLFPHIEDMNQYQDLSDTSCKPISATVAEFDPVRDLCILQTELKFDGLLPPIGSFDDVITGEEIVIFGYPHCVNGRRSLTVQKTEIGAKVLIESSGIKYKNAVINTQARPGQSGSLIYSLRVKKIVGILEGAWVGQRSGFGIISGVDPGTLHQTTHCISAEYIRGML